MELLWRHGGVFDKMVGDCIIGLFGPPFFRSSRRERCEALVRAACDIQRTTAAMSADPEVQSICERVGMPGLGVAVEGSQDATLQSLRYGELTETPVKNVAKPLRHHRLYLPD